MLLNMHVLCGGTKKGKWRVNQYIANVFDIYVYHTLLMYSWKPANILYIKYINSTESYELFLSFIDKIKKIVQSI